MSYLEELLASYPGLRPRMEQFMALYDAAQVLDDVKPPHGDTAAAFLREVADHLIRRAGLPEDFLQAIIRARPPFPMTTANCENRQ